MRAKLILATDGKSLLESSALKVAPFKALGADIYVMYQEITNDIQGIMSS